MPPLVVVVLGKPVVVVPPVLNIELVVVLVLKNEPVVVGLGPVVKGPVEGLKNVVLPPPLPGKVGPEGVEVIGPPKLNLFMLFDLFVGGL